MKRAILAVDIGGSKYMVGLLGENGEIFAREHYICSAVSSERIMEDIISAIGKLSRENQDYEPEMIGVTIPGLADPRRGYWVEASFSGIRDLAVGPILSSKFGIPVYVDNDGQACALAERLFGACREVQDFIYLTVSNGIGGAVFAKDKIYYGAFGNAGEFGHVSVTEGGRRCKCGKFGCLEMYAAGPGIVRNYIELGGPESMEGKKTEAKQIAVLAEAGDPAALETFRLEGYYLGKVIAEACNVLNPARVIVGGGVSLAFPVFEEYLLEEVQRSIYLSANRELKIMPSDFGYNGGLLGAAAVAVCGRDKKYGWGEV